jgi:hypothetical protein
MLAEKLHMTVEQLEMDMSVDEFVEWSIYLTIQAEEADKARRAAGNGTRSNPVRNHGKGPVGSRA